jgi:polyhydroxybutyrate depolymerase
MHRGGAGGPRSAGRRVWPALLAALVLVLATLPAPAAGAQSPSSGCGSPGAARRMTVSLTVGGVQRSALVNVPPAAASGAPLPVVVMFHAQSADGETTELQTGLSWLGNRTGFITVYPNAHGRDWQVAVGADRPNADVAFVHGLLEQLDDALCVDDSRIFGAGESNGASFLSRWACALSDRFAAIAVVAGDDGTAPGCSPVHPISVLEVHGTSDQDMRYASGAGARGGVGVWSFLDRWFAWDGCPHSALARHRLGPRVVWLGRGDCTQGTTVAHLRLVGEPHAWPTLRGVGASVRLSMRDVIWQFFSTHRVARL